MGEKLVSFNGQSLAGKRVKFPEIVKGKATILLFGYKQQSQFDIDRWLIGLDMKQVKVNVFEIPTIQGFIPRLLKNKIDSGMRKGIPKYLWKIVITVYKDGDRIQAFTGNTNPNNARVMLIDNKAKILYFTDNSLVALFSGLRLTLPPIP